ncbi:Ion channel [mine drainage metagenome]|uniref:Ion channel n=1 Tax=mine drainage metagenome TaxID=410659 RepID=A0A1J5RUU5_9ZZZZ
MIFTYLINSALVASIVLIHFEALSLLSVLSPKLTIKHRLRVLFGVFGALVAHVIEIWVFAFGYYFMVKDGRFGTLEGHFNHSLMDCSYFSFVNYTSLGFGDIIAKGDVRFTSGLEALTGLVLISWTASFMFIEMQKQWKEK